MTRRDMELLTKLADEGNTVCTLDAQAVTQFNASGAAGGAARAHRLP